jgi:hypothetical protein
MTKGRIVYAATAIAGAELGERVPHRVQSQAAAALLTRLTRTELSASSKSHSRALVAAAAGDGTSLTLGIDVEWMSPQRPFAAILQSLVPSISCPLDCQSFYRAWTFLEAYFKAFQELPNSRDVEMILKTAADRRAQVIGNGASVLHRNVHESFALCLVWKSSELCEVRYAPE